MAMRERSLGAARASSQSRHRTTARKALSDGREWRAAKDTKRDGDRAHTLENCGYER